MQAVPGAADPVVETRWLQAFNDRLGVLPGIVAAADLAAPDLRETLARRDRGLEPPGGAASSRSRPQRPTAGPPTRRPAVRFSPAPGRGLPHRIGELVGAHRRGGHRAGFPEP
jgi:hypothetical protein